MKILVYGCRFWVSLTVIVDGFENWQSFGIVVKNQKEATADGICKGFVRLLI